jgi:hypothetical protein
MVGVPSNAYNSVLTLTCINPSGGTGTASWVWEYRATGTFTLTGGGFTTTPTVTAYYQLINGLVTLTLANALTGVSNSNVMYLDGIPTYLRPPTVTQNIAVMVTNWVGGVTSYYPGDLYISPSSTIDIILLPSTGVFTTIGYKGLNPCVLTYMLL